MNMKQRHLPYVERLIIGADGVTLDRSARGVSQTVRLHALSGSMARLRGRAETTTFKTKIDGQPIYAYGVLSDANIALIDGLRDGTCRATERTLFAHDARRFDGAPFRTNAWWALDGDIMWSLDLTTFQQLRQFAADL